MMHMCILTTPLMPHLHLWDEMLRRQMKNDNCIENLHEQKLRVSWVGTEFAHTAFNKRLSGYCEQQR